MFAPRNPDDAKEVEIVNSWNALEGFGYAAEATGFDCSNLNGELPHAITFALDCLVRQREDLLREVLELRQPKHHQN